MIHLILNLTRPLFVLDAETTGLNKQSARIVELGFQRWEAVGMTREWRSPLNPGVPIPREAAEIHGFTNEFITGCRRCGKPADDFEHSELGDCQFAGWPMFRHIAVQLAQLLTNCDYAGKNIRYDLGVLSTEFFNANVEWTITGARIIDIDRLEAIATPRNLAALYEKYTGDKHEEAHGALADVRASTTVIVKQFETHNVLPRNLDELHKLQWPGWITTDGSVRMRNGIPTMMFGKHRERPMKEVPLSYWDWILSAKADFGPDMKELARQAKLGKFPEEQHANGDPELSGVRGPDGSSEEQQRRIELLGLQEFPRVPGDPPD